MASARLRLALSSVSRRIRSLKLFAVARSSIVIFDFLSSAAYLTMVRGARRVQQSSRCSGFCFRMRAMSTVRWWRYACAAGLMNPFVSLTGRRAFASSCGVGELDDVELDDAESAVESEEPSESESELLRGSAGTTTIRCVGASRP